MDACSEPTWTYLRRVSKPAIRFALPCLLILSGLLSYACTGPGYYYQVVSGHWKLMRARQDISKVLGNAETNPDLANSLRTASDILEFADQKLGLSAGGSYETYVETGRTAVTWNVVAAPEFSLTAKKWCFPVAGCVPYRGYFEKEKAQRYASKLRKKGLDVAVTPVTAYSTLGWFEDPLLDTMLHYSDMQLAATIIHELSHQRLYIKGDTAFNEAYASFVEFAGVNSWLQNRRDSNGVLHWKARRTAADEFKQLLRQSRKRLSDLYASPAIETEMRRSKQEIFATLRSGYSALRDGRWSGRDYFGKWFGSDMNNAKLALFESYEGGVCAFSGLFKLAEEDFIKFHQLVQTRMELGHEERNQWLTQNCPAIASGDNL